MRNQIGSSERERFPVEWHSCASIERWRRGLLHVTGLTPAETEARLDTLLQFCAVQGVSPETIADECRRGPHKMARREFYLNTAQNTTANRAIQSFLVHNGVNIFGELVCLPLTPEHVTAEQGEQWASRRQKENSLSSRDCDF